jgi:twitching motility protein PilT
MVPLNTKVLESSDTAALMKSITPERCQQELQEVGGCDFGFAFGEAARFRVAVFKQRGNIGLVLRRIPNEFLTFQQIGLPAVMEQLIQRPRGLILVTGPTGSGKTTTLASMINWINDNMDRHIITIEDPIEYYHKHKKCIVNQREVGIDVPDFPEAIRRALRMDPDIILVGEMRDLATIQAAITAAETGHIVFGTLHTNSAEGTVNRIIDVFPKEQQDQIRTQLSVAILGILAQALLPRKPKGMIAAFEMLVITPAISNLIRENKTYRIDSSIQTGRKHGMILLDDNLFNIWRQGLVEEEEVMFKARKPNDLRQRIENAKKGILDEEEIEEEEEEVKKK